MNPANGPRSSRKLGIMAKYWEPGHAKTRLGTALGMRAAAAIHREFFEFLTHSLQLDPAPPLDPGTGDATARNACLVPAQPPRFALEVVFEPTSRRAAFERALAANPLAPVPPQAATDTTHATSTTGAWSLQPQASGDLGERMRSWFRHTLAAVDSRYAVLIGCDCPTLTAATIAESFERLATCDVVLGPALDGGYYLIGLSGPYRCQYDGLFQNIPWSTAHVLETTLAAAEQANLSVGSLSSRRDVDELDDLQDLLSELAVSSNPRERTLGQRVAVAMRIVDHLPTVGTHNHG